MTFFQTYSYDSINYSNNFSFVPFSVQFIAVLVSVNVQISSVLVQF